MTVSTYQNPVHFSSVVSRASVAGETGRRLAEQLNRECQCVSLDRQAMRAELERYSNRQDLYRLIFEERPYLFTNSAVFISEGCMRRQWEIIAAVERVVALPAFQERVLKYAPAAARFSPKAQGVFLGYDFHLSPNGPQLIEINTNAGGAMLNVVLTRAQSACCEVVGDRRPSPGSVPALPSAMADSVEPEAAFLAMFLEEWRAHRDDEASLRCIAIVDEQPEAQYLWPEFLLFQKLFESNGLEAVICDPSELVFRDGALWRGSRRIDLVYNRLTDFGLEGESVRALREAYLADAAVITPHPHAHAIYADKRNLAILTDEEALRELGVDADTISVLMGGIAPTVRVRTDDADTLWSRRRKLFFKPAAGYGSKAAYRGDKLTRRVFEAILAGAYVAQALVPPTERQLKVAEELVDLKLDLRNYVYRGRVQLVAARLYRGQTTNFRTPGGGFAPVVIVPCLETG